MSSHSQAAACAFIDSWLKYRIATRATPGMSIAIYHQDHVVFSGAYGFANIESRTLLTPDHVFAVASQSKMLTAAAILQLVSRKKLGLDTPAYTYLPWLAAARDERMRRVTPRHLLTHTAGLMRDCTNSEHWLFSAPFPTRKTLQEDIQSTTLLFKPGTLTKYSNLGYALLGQLIEAVSHQPYARYSTEHIMLPLGLTTTAADCPPDRSLRIATGYGSPYQYPLPHFEHTRSTEALAAATGAYSTPADMCRLAAAHFPGNTSLLSERSKKEAQRIQRTVTTGYDAGYQLGLGLELFNTGTRRLFGHSGHMGGHTTATLFDPKERLAVSVMLNSRDIPITQITSGIFGTLDFFARYASKPAPKDREHFNGRLANALGTVQIVATAGKIVMIDPDDWEPFAAYEELAIEKRNILRITTEGSVFNQGELLRYAHNNNKSKPDTVYYSGIPMQLLRD